jgi:exonuclease III
MTALPSALIAGAVSLPKWESQLFLISMYGTFDLASQVTPNLHRMISDLHPLFSGKASKGRIIIGGDWNVDRKYNRINAGKAPLHRIVFERLEDPFYGLKRTNEKPLRTINHRSKFSYQNDYIYASKRLLPRLLKPAEVVKDLVVEALSDHYPVIAEFEV